MLLGPVLLGADANEGRSALLEKHRHFHWWAAKVS
jgi:hypothetical protein